MMKKSVSLFVVLLFIAMASFVECKPQFFGGEGFRGGFGGEGFRGGFGGERGGFAGFGRGFGGEGFRGGFGGERGGLFGLFGR